jgi:spermidine synthase
MLRLVFGSSTGASAAVLAIFMGGLGLGGYLLGRRGDRSPNPLRLYGNLELGISAAAAASVPLIAAVRALYLSAGGTQAMGIGIGTVVRLALAAVVLGLPTFLMGGTLPAAVRAITRAEDLGRHSVGWLYAINTLGAVAGATVTTFVLIELVGIRQTIWLAALLNLLIAVGARAVAREQGTLDPVDASDDEATPDAIAPRVWYRMLAPILGGSTYTFGVILLVALAGIGLGGLIYALTSTNRRPTARHFAVTCLLEALAIAAPFAVGDQVALLALELRGLQAGGFVALAMGWSAVVCVVVLPAALVAGYQFPVLVALLGIGRQQVARQVGLTYAWNTIGAILGSLAGGFGLLPLLSAPTAWRLSTWLLITLAALFLLHARIVSPARTASRWAVPAIGVLALVLSLAPGPSAFWRHSGIGAGRIDKAPESPNDLQELRNQTRRHVEWETDGRESSVALNNRVGYSFFVNGKSDGSARGDAPTQVMGPLVGALLHRAPRLALVIGLGTGSSAGWLAQVDTVERVDVVELEPKIRHVAEACAPVNWDVMQRDDVEVIYADGREYLLTTDESYDIIFSEPSNPYRAGISSLFTREFYQAATERLSEDGILIQWLQGYEVDAQVIRTVYATLASVFPYVETWQVQASDLLLLASKQPVDHDLERVALRAGQDPFARAMNAVWGVSGVEGFYASFVAAAPFATAVAEVEGDALNTDDRPRIEFGFARNVGREGSFSVQQLRWLAEQRGESLPPITGGRLDYRRVAELRESMGVMFHVAAPPPETDDLGWRARYRARSAYIRRDLEATLEFWDRQEEEPQSRSDLILFAESLAEAADDRLPEIADRLRVLEPVEAEAVLARWHLRNDRVVEASEYLLSALVGYRTDPWPHTYLMLRALNLVRQVARQDPEYGIRLWQVLEEPFAVKLLNETRNLLRGDLARLLDFPQMCGPSFAVLEPWVPWTETFLRLRRDCYRTTSHLLEARAQSDLERFYADGEIQLWWELLPEERLDTPEIELPEADRLGRE